MIGFVNNFRKELSLKYIFRSGFLFDEAEVYETAAMGFDGALLHVGFLDVHKIQLFTEIGRELGIYTVWVCGDENEVSKVLETDSPYIGISTRFHVELKNETKAIQELTALLPRNVSPWVLLSELSASRLNFVTSEGFGYVCGQV
jgi:indole-3-glycerol phosphate synthase